MDLIQDFAVLLSLLIRLLPVTPVIFGTHVYISLDAKLLGSVTVTNTGAEVRALQAIENLIFSSKDIQFKNNLRELSRVSLTNSILIY